MASQISAGAVKFALMCLDDSRIKDLRTGVENRNTGAVLDGDLDKFVEEYLKQFT
jgi:protein subunit release factor B